MLMKDKYEKITNIFLIDISESMVGEPIQQVEEGLATIINIKTDPRT
jgi:uncharacterized protein YegL